MLLSELHGRGRMPKNEREQAEVEGVYRMSGHVLCDVCEKFLSEHPPALEPHLLNFQDEPYLNRLCNGDLVHL